MLGVLIGGVGAVTKIPFPRLDIALGVVMKCNMAIGRADHLEAPVGFDGLTKAFFERHQAKCNQIGGIAVHGGFMGEVPESAKAFGFFVVVIEDRPRHANDLVFLEFRLHGPGLIGRCIIKGSYKKFECQLAIFAVFEVVIRGGIGPGQIFDPRLGAPDHGPVFAFGGRKDVIILGMNAMKQGVSFEFVFQF